MKNKHGVTKNCLFCKNEFVTQPRFNFYCSQACKNPVNRIGNVPWNKGIKFTDEQKSKLNTDGLKKGRGWNKGLSNDTQSIKWTGSNNPNWEGKLNNLRPKKEIDNKFLAYKSECHKATHRSRYVMQKEGLIPANTGRRKNQYQLDHIIPFKQGYELGIDPKIIGGRSNLQWILGEENRKKWDNFQTEEVLNKVLGEYNGLLR